MGYFLVVIFKYRFKNKARGAPTRCILSCVSSGLVARVLCIVQPYVRTFSSILLYSIFFAIRVVFSYTGTKLKDTTYSHEIEDFVETHILQAVCDMLRSRVSLGCVFS